MCLPSMSSGHICGCNLGKPGRFLEPCVLLLLKEQPTYGYDLISQLDRFGFDPKTQDVGAVYRVLRKLEHECMVMSQWQAGEGGPAKRLYEVTAKGEGFLQEWVESIKFTKDRLEKYLLEYEKTIKNK
ncbi:MAG: helix-turn-helix transcriptional regulator [bacterium]